MAFEKVSSGQIFEAKTTTWNGFIDAANYVQQQQIKLGSDNSRSTNENGIVLVKNGSGTSMPQFALVTLVDMMIKPKSSISERTFCNDVPFFEVDAYTEETKDKPIAILQEPIARGATGKALLLGVTPAFVTIDNGSHNSAMPDEKNKFRLKSSSDGDIKILWKPSGNGEKLCMLAVGLGGALSYRGNFKLTLENNSINIFDGSDEESSNAGFVLCNGELQEVSKGSVSASSGYVCLKGVLNNKTWTVSFEIKSDLSGDETTGYYALGYVKSAVGGGDVELIQYYHNTPNIFVFGDCKVEDE